MNAPRTWFDRLGIDRNGVRIVGQVRGMITLTSDPDGVHTLWIFDHPLMEGNAATLRAEYQRYHVEYLE
jgi:hypothetical protein